MVETGHGLSLGYQPGRDGRLKGAAEQKHENGSLECASFLLIISSARLFLQKH